MKLQRGTSNQGGILVVTIVICSLVGLMLAAYLSMVSSQHSFTQRSQIWNNTIPLCEAGIEEAMAHINHTSVSTNFATNGWRSHGTWFTNEGYLNGGKYTMSIDDKWPPMITAWGSLKKPLGNGEVTRAIQVRTRMNQRFPAAVLARGTVSLGGSGVIDSFNSTNSLYSDTNGQYIASKRSDVALIGTTSRTPGAIDVGSMTVYGSAATGPGGTVNINNSGAVGDTNWNRSFRGIQPGHHINDANFYIPPADLPTDFNKVTAAPLNAASAPGVLWNGEYYKYTIFLDGDYKAPSISLRNGEKMIVRGKARLWVQNYFLVAQSTSHLLIDTNSSLEMYVGGLVDVTGGGCINKGGYAINLSIVCLSSAQVTYAGNGALVGTIYAPLSTVRMSGTSDAIGAVTCDNFTLSGGMGIHFDEALKANPKIRFLADSWKEVDPLNAFRF